MRTIILVSVMLAVALGQTTGRTRETTSRGQMGGEDFQEIKLPFENDDDESGAEPKERPAGLVAKFNCAAKPTMFKFNSTVGDTCDGESTVFVTNPSNMDYTGGKLMVYASPQCSDVESWQLLNEGSLIDVPAIAAGANETIDLASVDTLPRLPCGLGCFAVNITGDSDVAGAMTFTGFKSDCGTPQDVDIELVMRNGPTQPIVLKYGQSLQEALDDAGITISLKAKAGFVKQRSTEMSLSVFAYLRHTQVDNIDEYFEVLNYDDESVVGRKKEDEDMGYNDRLYNQGNSGMGSGGASGMGESGASGMGETTTSGGSNDKTTVKPSNDKTTVKPRVNGRRKRNVGNSTQWQYNMTTPYMGMGGGNMGYTNPVRELWGDIVYEVFNSNGPMVDTNKSCENYYPSTDLDDLLVSPEVMVLGEVGPQPKQINFDDVHMTTATGICGLGVIQLIIVADVFSMLDEKELCNNFVKIPVRLPCPRDHTIPNRCDILIDPRTRGHRVLLTQHNYVYGHWNGFGSDFRQSHVDAVEKYELYMFKYMEKRFQKMAARNPGICRLAEHFDKSLERKLMANILKRQSKQKRQANFDAGTAYDKMVEVINEAVAAANDSSVIAISPNLACKYIGALRNGWIMYARKDYRSINLVLKFTGRIYMKASEALAEHCMDQFEVWAQDNISEENWFLVENSAVTGSLTNGFSEYPGTQGDFLRAVFGEIHALQAEIMARESDMANMTEIEPEKFEYLVKNGTCPNADVKTVYSQKSTGEQFLTYIHELTALLGQGGRYGPIDGNQLCGHGLLQEWVARGGANLIGKRLKKYKRAPTSYLNGLYKRFMFKLAHKVKDNVTDADMLRAEMLEFVNKSVIADKDKCQVETPSDINDVLPVYWRMEQGKLFMGLRTPLDADYGAETGERKALWKYVSTCSCENCGWGGMGGNWGDSGMGDSGMSSMTKPQGGTTRRSLTG